MAYLIFCNNLFGRGVVFWEFKNGELKKTCRVSEQCRSPNVHISNLPSVHFRLIVPQPC